MRADRPGDHRHRHPIAASGVAAGAACPGEFQSFHSAFRNLVSCAENGTGAECAQGWMNDAATLLDTEPDRDFADGNYAKTAAEYYVDEILRSAERRAEFCPA